MHSRHGLQHPGALVLALTVILASCGGASVSGGGPASEVIPGGQGGRAGQPGQAGIGGAGGKTDAGPAAGSNGRDAGRDAAVNAGGRGGNGGPAGGNGGGAGGRGGGAGGRGGDGAAPTPPVDAATAIPGEEIHAMPALPPRRSGNVVFHSTNVSMWEIHDMAVYTQYKANFDEIIAILERGYFGIAKRLGTGHKLPLRVIIEAGGCCGGWAGGGDVGYADGDFKSDGAMNWVRGVVIGEVVNGVTGAVSAEWPRDWWADTAWYFPGFVTVDVMKDVVPSHATKWESEEKYPTYPVYVLYKALLAEQGWTVYQKLFALVKTDKIDWSKIGANPSAIKTNYVVAYLSLAAGMNLGTRFQGARVATDPAIVQAIMDTRAKLAAGGTPSAWARFRAGDHQGAGM